MRMWLTLVVLLVTVGVGLCATAKRPKAVKVHRHEHFRDHVMDLLPDISDHGVMRLLRCSSCMELSAQLYDALLDVYNRNGNPSHHDLVEVIDNLCQHHVNMYGLVMDPSNQSATTVFSRDASVQRIQGLWINKFIKDRCAQLMVQHEETILAQHPEADSLQHFQEMVCVQWDNSCTSSPASRQTKSAKEKPLSRFSRSIRAEEM